MCPICSKPVRSDSSATRYCKLCGMPIDEAEQQFIYIAEKDIELHFCCEGCMKKYVETFNPMKIGEKIITVEDIIEERAQHRFTNKRRKRAVRILEGDSMEHDYPGGFN